MKPPPLAVVVAAPALATAAMISGCGDAASPARPESVHTPEPTRLIASRLLATLALDEDSGASAPIAFEIATSTTSFMVTARTSTEVRVAVTSLGRDAAESALSPVDWPDLEPNSARTCWTCLWPSHLDRSAGGVVVDGAGGTLAGAWSVRAIARAGETREVPHTPVSVDVWLTEVAATNDLTLLALDVVVVAGASVDNAQVGAWLGAATAALAQAAIVVRAVGDPIVAPVEVTEGADGGVVGLPTAESHGALVVVFADALGSSGDSSGALAVSGGLPGPWPSVDEPAATVVIDVPATLAAGVSPGVLLAHELGHQLGLQHVIERGAAPGGVGEDRLDDTRFDASDNLMFWEARIGGTALSPGQIRQLRAHPRLVELYDE